ncbi:MAG: universal stress protein [Caldiserica bacterium]|nr:universal stress protein [Caldisericota bacterium]
MFKKILIVVDNSEAMKDVVEYTTTLFPDAFFYLFSIINLGSFAGYYTKVVFKEMNELSDQTLAMLESLLEEKSIQFATKTEVGNPVDEICSFVRSNDIDLIVIETHAGITANKIKLGKTTFSMIMHSRIPVLLLGEDLKPNPRPRILHPTSGSKYSELATRVTGEVAAQWKSPVDVLVLSDKRESVKRSVEQILANSSVSVSFSFAEHGKEVSSVISQASNADIIIGSRGSPRKSYKLRFLFRPLALDPHIRLIVAFLPKPFLLVCD